MRRQREPQDPDERQRAHDAFTALYREHAPSVYRLTRQLAGSGGEVEDIVAETFLTAWRRWDELSSDERPPGPWLLGVAARQALNKSRGRRRRDNLLAHLSSRTEPRAHPDPADEVVVRLDDLMSVERTRKALQVLSAHEAEALALCVWSELSYAEAADALGVSTASIRNRLARARRKLRAELAPDASAGVADDPRAFDAHDDETSSLGTSSKPDRDHPTPYFMARSQS